MPWPWVLGLALWATNAPAQPADGLTVVVKEGQSVRSLAQEYLNDPDMWQEILKANGLAAATDVKAGMKLKIPASDVARATTTLAAATEAIDQATREGAPLFAAEAMAQATKLRDDALVRRRSGDWAGCLQLAQASRKETEAALARSRARRNVTGEATLAERSGTVQSRKQAELAWADAPLGAPLAEGQKVRTLAESRAELKFPDGSRLRLSENSQAVIQKMRQDLLESRQESKVSILEGDAMAMLDPGNRQKRSFDLDAGGATAKVRSTQFWVKKEVGVTRFANYEGELEVSSGNGSVTLKANQGAMVQGNGKPTAPRDLLPAPEPLSPEAESNLPAGKVAFAWKPVDKATTYVLEVATDPAFRKVVRSVKDLKAASLERAGFKESLYYWRLSAVDADGFPGPPSPPRMFRVSTDTAPPYLAILTPRPNAVVRQAALQVTGEVEPGATLTLGKEAVPAGADGKFSAQVALRRGANTLTLVARDAAGNTSTVTRSVTFASEGRAEIAWDAALATRDGHFVVASPAFTLSGQTESEAALTVRDAAGAVRGRAFAEADGSFRMAIELQGEREELAVGIAAGEQTSEQKIVVEVDREPPVIALAAEPAAVTTSAELHLSGTASGAARLTLEGAELPLHGDGFATTVTLQPGPNRLRLVATDAAGNTSSLQRGVILDQQPPRLVKSAITPKVAAGGERVLVRVSAADESGLREAAKFTLQVGGFVHTGWLRLLRAEQVYEGTVSLPDGAKGEVKLRSVTLNDYQGNLKEYVTR